MNSRDAHWYVAVLMVVVACRLGVAASLMFGPQRWVSSHSLTVIRMYTHIPWPVIGAAFAVCGALLCSWRTRLAGYLLLAMLVGVFVGCSCLYTLLPGDTTNVIVAGFSPLTVLMLCAGVRYANRARKLRNLARASRS